MACLDLSTTLSIVKMKVGNPQNVSKYYDGIPQDSRLDEATSNPQNTKYRTTPCVLPVVDLL